MEDSSLKGCCAGRACLLRPLADAPDATFSYGLSVRTPISLTEDGQAGPAFERWVVVEAASLRGLAFRDGGGGVLEVAEGERFIHSRCHHGELREVATCLSGSGAGTSTFSSPVTCTLSQVVLLAKLNGTARYYHNVPVPSLNMLQMMHGIFFLFASFLCILVVV